MSKVQLITLHPDAAREDIAATLLMHGVDIELGECTCGETGRPWALALHVADEAIKAATA